MSLTIPQKDNIIAKILSGDTYLTINGTTFISRLPNRVIKHKAHLLYSKAFEESRFNDWMYKEDIRDFLRRTGIIKHTDANLKQIEKVIEDKKIAIYDSLLRTNNMKQLRKELNMVRAKHNEMLYNQHFLDYVTPDGYATMIMQQYIIAATLYTEDNKRVWEDDEIEMSDFFLLDQVMGELERGRAGIDALREISRSEPWRSLWTISKANPFGKSAGEWSEEQKQLALLSRMYDNIFEHPECPPDSIIEDDDLLDGWMAKNRRIREKEKIENRLNDSIGKNHKNDAELFVPVATQEQAQEIYSLNDVNSRMIIKQREASLTAMGVVKEDQLPDVKLGLHLQAQQEYMAKVKGK